MNETNQRNPNELGAVWLRVSKQGVKYYSGKITVNGEDINIAMFKNNRKEPGSKQPDWNISRSTFQESNKTSSPRRTPSAPQGGRPNNWSKAPRAPVQTQLRPQSAPVQPQQESQDQPTEDVM